MNFFRRAVLITPFLVTSSVPFASAADNLQTVLAKMDASAATFKSAQADIEWDSVQTNPIPDTSSQSGTVVFERKNGEVQAALRLKMSDGKPYEKDMVYANGVGKMYEPSNKQLNVYPVGSHRQVFDTMLTLGFGGSGTDLQKNWTVQFLGDEKVNGIPTVKLQLTPKDSEVLKAAPKVILWVDMSKGIGIKQQRFQADGTYAVVTYSNIRLNGKVPSNAFELNTAPGTQTINH